MENKNTIGICSTLFECIKLTLYKSEIFRVLFQCTILQYDAFLENFLVDLVDFRGLTHMREYVALFRHLRDAKRDLTF